MTLERFRSPLRPGSRPLPELASSQILIRVEACGVCRTDLHLLDGELPDAKLPVVPGHEIVGRVVAIGGEDVRFRIGEQVGLPWLGSTCGKCRYCRTGAENLCDRARFTGHDIDGGYAEFTIANSDYCFPVPDSFDAAHAAPLLCAGLIGYRSYRIALQEITRVAAPRTGVPAIVAEASQEDAPPTSGLESEYEMLRIGLYGFGAAAHILAQIAVHDGHEVFAFTRPGDTEGQTFARDLGAAWAGGSDQPAPEELDAAILFAPIGALVPVSLRAVRKGGAVICAGIHMSDIPSFPYSILWGERAVKSVANLTRRDGELFFAKIATVPLRVEVEPLPLDQANDALRRLRDGALRGAAVLIP
jgi:propanol-preferring alcohol dehydrogenase